MKRCTEMVKWALAPGMAWALMACADAAGTPEDERAAVATTATGSATTGAGQASTGSTSGDDSGGLAASTAEVASTGAVSGTTGAAGTTATGGAPPASTGGATTSTGESGVTAGVDAGGAAMADAGGESSTEAGAVEEAGPFRFTDPLTAGATIPSRHKCPRSQLGNGMGDNLSPPLAWSGAPAGTQSFALILYDTRYNLFHWALWDLPATLRSLPEGIPGGYDIADPAGAHQGGTASRGEPNAYFGPCSDAGGLAGTYEYRLFALSEATLNLSADATGTAIQAAVDAATLEGLVWEGTPE